MASKTETRTITARVKQTQSGTFVAKATIYSDAGMYLGKLQVSGQDLDEANGRMGAMLDLLGATVEYELVQKATDVVEAD